MEEMCIKDKEKKIKKERKIMRRMLRIITEIGPQQIEAKRKEEE